MDSQQLNRRISLQSPVIVRSPSGGQVPGWIEYATPWARKRDLSGNERAATSHGGKVDEARTEWIIRYRAGVLPAHRILFAGQAYPITHVKDLDDARAWLLLTCTSGVATDA